MKKILILGGGFIGTSIVEKLINTDRYSITVVNKNKSNKFFDGVEYIECDVSNFEEVSTTFFNREFDYVINTLGYINHGMFPINHLRNGGYDKLISIINIFKLLSFKKIINIGSSLELIDGDDGYQLVNQATTKLLKSISNFNTLKAVTIITPHLIGANQKPPRLLPYILECFDNNNIIVIKNNYIRNYIYIKDYIDLVVTILDDENPPEIIYAEGIINATPVDFIRIVEELKGKKAETLINESVELVEKFPSLNYTHWRPGVTLKNAIIEILKKNTGDFLHAKEITKNKKIRLSKSSIGSEERASVARVLKNEYLGMGSAVLEFEESINRFIGVRACCVVNGTAALHLALEACGVGVGDEVIVPSFTYIATYQAISATGATPVHCEINPRTGSIDINDMRMKISSKTKAIVPVHYIGSCEGIEIILEIANKLKIRVIEDAAHSFGGEDSRGKIGGHGDIVCFSFDGIKNITSGEGGAVLSNDQNVLNFVSDARMLGVTGDSMYRYINSRALNKIDVYHQGWRYHMSNIMAAIGTEQIKKIDAIAQSRRKIAYSYIKKLSNHESIQILEKDYSKIIPHAFGILIDGIDKNELIRIAALNDIELGYGYYPNHFLKYYSHGEKLPITENFYNKLIALPIHIDLSENDQDRVCEFLLNYLRRVV